MRLRVKSKFWIEDQKGRPVFGGGRQRILERIDQLGSIKAAAEDLKMSYRAVWGKIRTTEQRLGFQLVDTNLGARSRGARLTPAAHRLLDLFDQLQTQGNAQADQLFERLFAEVKNDPEASMLGDDSN
jgi:molybdate transport system regulatory protein